MRNFIRQMIDRKSLLRHWARQGGFTLLEAIIAIVMIGIAIPSIMVPFSGLKATKKPDIVVQASFIAQELMEKVADRKSSTLNCADVTGTYGAFTATCAITDVGAAAPNTDGSGTFAKKMKITLTHTDGTSYDFYTLYGL